MADELPPQSAREILEMINKGDFTKSQVAHNAKIPALAGYLVLLAGQEPVLNNTDSGTCLSQGELWDFVHTATCFRNMVKAARHIRGCHQCHRRYCDFKPEV